MTQRARRAISRRAARLEITVTTEALLDVRDDLSVAANFSAGVYLACLGLQSSERAALCAISDAARDKLVATVAALDAILEKTSAPGRTAAQKRKPFGDATD